MEQAKPIHLFDKAQMLIEKNFFSSLIIQRVLNLKCPKFIDQWITKAFNDAENGVFDPKSTESHQRAAFLRSRIPIMEQFNVDGDLQFESGGIEFNIESICDKDECPNFIMDRYSFSDNMLIHDKLV